VDHVVHNWSVLSRNWFSHSTDVVDHRQVEQSISRKRAIRYRCLEVILKHTGDAFVHVIPLDLLFHYFDGLFRLLQYDEDIGEIEIRDTKRFHSTTLYRMCCCWFVFWL
jgi:hypothetical protein